MSSAFVDACSRLNLPSFWLSTAAVPAVLLLVKVAPHLLPHFWVRLQARHFLASVSRAHACVRSRSLARVRFLACACSCSLGENSATPGATPLLACVSLVLEAKGNLRYFATKVAHTLISTRGGSEGSGRAHEHSRACDTARVCACVRVCASLCRVG